MRQIIIALHTNGGVNDGMEKTMNVQKPKLFAAALLIAGCTMGVGAQAASAYAGVGLGGQTYPGTLNGLSTSGSAVSGNIFAGYQFTENFALELGLMGLGAINTPTGHVDSYGSYIDAIGILPVSDKFSLSGRVGVAYLNVNTPPGNDSSSGLKLGLGADYAISRAQSVGLEWDRYQLNVFGDTPTADQLTIDLKFRF